MTRDELVIKLIKEFKSDDVVIIGDNITGWANIGEVKENGSCISIMADMEPVFSSDR